MSSTIKFSKNSSNVFVVHGRDLQARDALFYFLSAIGLCPIEWSKAITFTNKTNPFIGEVLDAAFLNAHAVLILLTPDDEARLQKKFIQSRDLDYEHNFSFQARPNVLFEAGMAMGRAPNRTIFIELGQLRPFSDIAGRHTIKFDGSIEKRFELIQRLEAAGCPINLSLNNWKTAGQFPKYNLLS